MNKILDLYKIDILNFSEKIYTHEFRIASDFFAALEQDIVTNGDLSVNLILDCNTNMIKADFNIAGVVELTCDRSLKTYMHHVASTDTIMYKYSDREEEFSDLVTYIKKSTQAIDFSIPIFEFIVLNLPSKKIHPDLLSEIDDDSDDNTLIYSTLNNEPTPSQSQTEEVDPRWSALKKLKDSV